MPKDIRVILLEDIASLGRAGDVVTVAEGFARNALFPDGKAALATESVQRRTKEKVETQKKLSAAKIAELQGKAQELEGTELTIEARVKEGNEIFGRITTANLAKELKQQANVSVKQKDIDLAKAITALGTYDITVHLSPEVETHIKVTIEADPDSLPINSGNE